MPLFYQQYINATTRLAVWEIDENEEFFNLSVPLHRNITHPLKRMQHLAGRFLLPFLFYDFPNHEIEIAGTRKPFLPNEQYHFSISHCSKYAAAIVSSCERVGIDVELITPRLEKIKGKFLHPDELQFVNTQPLPQQLNLLSILWSGKEAMYKWYGAGEVDFSDMMRIRPVALEPEGKLDAAFLKNDFTKQLTVHYKQIGQLTLSWVSSDN